LDEDIKLKMKRSWVKGENGNFDSFVVGGGRENGGRRVW
jgi:hypothetical protein